MKAVVEIELIRLIIHNNDGRGNRKRGQPYRTTITLQLHHRGSNSRPLGVHYRLGEGGKGVDESDGKVEGGWL